MNEKTARYSAGNIINKGSTSSVYKAFDRKKERNVVIKVVPSAQKDFFLQEVSLLRSLKGHKNIVKLYSRSKENEEISEYYLILEYLSMDLFSFLQQNPVISLQSVVHIMKNICNGVKHCHSNCIAHLDLKPENILVSDDLSKIKLGDFGGSVRWSSPAEKIDYSASSTPIYSAPEIHFSPFLGDKADIWSLGVIFHLLYCKKFPFFGKTEEEQLQNARYGFVTISPEFPRQYVSILRQMLNFEPTKRPTIEAIIHFLNNPS